MTAAVATAQLIDTSLTRPLPSTWDHPSASPPKHNADHNAYLGSQQATIGAYQTRCVSSALSESNLLAPMNDHALRVERDTLKAQNGALLLENNRLLDEIHRLTEELAASRQMQQQPADALKEPPNRGPPVSASADAAPPPSRAASNTASSGNFQIASTQAWAEQQPSAAPQRTASPLRSASPLAPITNRVGGPPPSGGAAAVAASGARCNRSPSPDIRRRSPSPNREVGRHRSGSRPVRRTIPFWQLEMQRQAEKAAAEAAAAAAAELAAADKSEARSNAEASEPMEAALSEGSHGASQETRRDTPSSQHQHQRQRMGPLPQQLVEQKEAGHINGAPSQEQQLSSSSGPMEVSAAALDARPDEDLQPQSPPHDLQQPRHQRKQRRRKQPSQTMPTVSSTELLASPRSGLPARLTAETNAEGTPEQQDRQPGPLSRRILPAALSALHQPIAASGGNGGMPGPGKRQLPTGDSDVEQGSRPIKTLYWRFLRGNRLHSKAPREGAAPKDCGEPGESEDGQHPPITGCEPKACPSFGPPKASALSDPKDTPRADIMEVPTRTTSATPRSESMEVPTRTSSATPGSELMEAPTRTSSAMPRSEFMDVPARTSSATHDLSRLRSWRPKRSQPLSV